MPRILARRVVRVGADVLQPLLPRQLQHLLIHLLSNLLLHIFLDPGAVRRLHFPRPATASGVLLDGMLVQIVFLVLSDFGSRGALEGLVIPECLGAPVDVEEIAEIATASFAEAVGVVGGRRVRYASGGSNVRVAELHGLYGWSGISLCAIDREVSETYKVLQYEFWHLHFVCQDHVVRRPRRTLQCVV